MGSLPETILIGCDAPFDLQHLRIIQPMFTCCLKNEKATCAEITTQNVNEVLSVERRQCVHLSIETKLIEQIYQVSVQKTDAHYVLHVLYIHSIKHPSL